MKKEGRLHSQNTAKFLLWEITEYFFHIWFNVSLCIPPFVLDLVDRRREGRAATFLVVGFPWKRRPYSALRLNCQPRTDFPSYGSQNSRVFALVRLGRTRNRQSVDETGKFVHNKSVGGERTSKEEQSGSTHRKDIENKPPVQHCRSIFIATVALLSDRSTQQSGSL